MRAREYLCIVCFCLSAHLQAQEFEERGDCNFEEPCNYLQPISDSSIWEISDPNKKKISAALSPTNCLITDANQPVSTNQLDYVQFDIPANEYGQTPTGMDLKFRYKYDLSDSLDFFGIELAFDSSEYRNLRYLYDHNITEYYAYVFYDMLDILVYESDTAVSGTSSDWNYGYIFITFYETLQPQGEFGVPLIDTVHLRFYLRSDSIDDKGAGIAIDDFSFEFYHWGAVEDKAQTQSLIAFPNPAKGKCSLMSPALSGTLQTVDIRSVTGQQQRSEQRVYFDGSGQASISLESLPPGTYLCSITSGALQYRQVLIRQ